MKTARFAIKKIEKNGYLFWGIHVPAYLNPAGKSGYFYFHTKAEAERKRGELLAATRTESKITLLSNAQQTDAIRALERLSEHGLNLTLDRAIELALPHLKSTGQYITVATLVKDFARLKESSWSASSRRNFSTACRLFLATFGGHSLTEVTAKELDNWLNSTFSTPGYRANIIRTLRPAFSYAVRQEMIPASPFSKLETVRTRPRQGIDIFTPDEARRLLTAAPSDCLMAYALLLFSGIRPIELTRLRWGDIKDGFIHIRPEIAKTAQVRNIEIEPNLAAFIAASGHHSPNAPIIPTNWKRKNQATRRAAGLAHRQDTARHSYATYYLARYKDANTLKSNMGHSRSSDILFAHYRAAATPVEADAYWSLTPSDL